MGTKLSAQGEEWEGKRKGKNMIFVHYKVNRSKTVLSFTGNAQRAKSPIPCHLPAQSTKGSPWTHSISFWVVSLDPGTYGKKTD